MRQKTAQHYVRKIQKGNKEVDSQIVMTSHTQAETLSIRHSKTLITLHQHQKKLTKLQRQE